VVFKGGRKPYWNICWKGSPFLAKRNDWLKTVFEENDGVEAFLRFLTQK